MQNRKANSARITFAHSGTRHFPMPCSMIDIQYVRLTVATTSSDVVAGICVLIGPAAQSKPERLSIPQYIHSKQWLKITGRAWLHRWCRPQTSFSWEWSQGRSSQHIFFLAETSTKTLIRGAWGIGDRPNEAYSLILKGYDFHFWSNLVLASHVHFRTDTRLSLAHTHTHTVSLNIKLSLIS